MRVLAVDYEKSRGYVKHVADISPLGGSFHYHLHIFTLELSCYVFFLDLSDSIRVTCWSVVLFYSQL